MASVNKTILIGNLGADPEIRYMPDGTPTASLSLATTDKWKDKKTGEVKEKTEWHHIVFFKGLAEVVGDYLKKGSQIYVEGKLRTRKWEDKDGIGHYITEIVGRELQMLSKRDFKGSPSAPGDNESPTFDNFDDDNF